MCRLRRADPAVMDRLPPAPPAGRSRPERGAYGADAACTRHQSLMVAASDNRLPAAGETHGPRTPLRAQGHRLRAVPVPALAARRGELRRGRAHGGDVGRRRDGDPDRDRHHADLPVRLRLSAADRPVEAPLHVPALGLGRPAGRRAVAAPVPDLPDGRRRAGGPRRRPGAPARGHLGQPRVDDLPVHDLPRDRRRGVRRDGGVLRGARRPPREHHHGGRLDLVGPRDDHDGRATATSTRWAKAVAWWACCCCSRGSACSRC